MKQTIINTNIKKWRPGMVITIVHPSGLRRIFRVNQDFPCKVMGLF